MIHTLNSFAFTHYGSDLSPSNRTLPSPSNSNNEILPRSPVLDNIASQAYICPAAPTLPFPSPSSPRRQQHLHRPMPSESSPSPSAATVHYTSNHDVLVHMLGTATGATVDVPSQRNYTPSNLCSDIQPSLTTRSQSSPVISNDSRTSNTSLPIDSNVTCHDIVSSVVSTVNSGQLLWSCKLTAVHSSVSVKVAALIDTGASVVLIRDTLVNELQLPLICLDKPMFIKTATNNRKQLCHAVDILLTSRDSLYTAKPIRAIVSDSLSNDIILGMPFLEINAIVVDASTGRVTDKMNDYHLIDPQISTVKRQKHSNIPKPHTRLLTTRKYRNTLLADLKNRLAIVKRSLDKNHTVTVQVPEIIVAQIASRIENIEESLTLEAERSSLINEFESVFATIPHVDELPTDVLAEIKLKDASHIIQTRTYACPRRYRQAWKTLIQQHLDSGRIRVSSAPQASPAFIIPKADPMALPRWVNDYRQLNKNTVPDAYPLPRIDDILADCGKGKIWGTIDMTNAFFQTKMRPSDIPLTAVSTPFGLYEWCVMPMGLRNAPSIHQRRVNKALQEFIGEFCHVYIDDIVIWSNCVEEHRTHVRHILTALRAAGLYCNLKKTNLFQREINFLGHTINAKGIYADDKKIERIVNWPQPSSAKDVRQFLGLVRYLAAFLPQLALHTSILNKLTDKDSDLQFPEWTDAHQSAFQGIKNLVISSDCLTVIDHAKMPEHRIFVTTDASDYQSGAMLSFGPTWETSRPVAFESRPFKKAELNYPVHEKELLAIIRALHKWRSDLLGVPFTVLTDHCTLECFESQKHLSRG